MAASPSYVVIGAPRNDSCWEGASDISNWGSQNVGNFCNEEGCEKCCAAGSEVSGLADPAIACPGFSTIGECERYNDDDDETSDYCTWICAGAVSPNYVPSSCPNAGAARSFDVPPGQ